MSKLEKETKESYLQTIKAEESNVVHVRLEKKQYVTDENGDPVKVSKPYIQYFGTKGWHAAKQEDRLKRQGYQVEILFDPRKDKEAWEKAMATKANAGKIVILKGDLAKKGEELNAISTELADAKAALQEAKNKQKGAKDDESKTATKAAADEAQSKVDEVQSKYDALVAEFRDIESKIEALGGSSED